MPSNDFGSLTGRIRLQRPGISIELANLLINDRLREILDMRPQWAGLLTSVTVPFPTAYTTGGVTLTTFSKTVTGTTTNWPVADVVNTTLAERIPGPNQVWVTPASMDGISLDTVLYVDGGGANPETLPVLDILGPRVLLNFIYAHAAGSSATTSSLVGLQLRVSGSTSPIFTVTAVSSTTTLTIDQVWGAAALTNAGYQIYKMYTGIGPYVREIITGTDPVQNIDLKLNIQQEQLNRWDPNRQSTNSPIGISPKGASPSGTLLFEVWPAPTTEYTLQFYVANTWPDMRLPSDRLPPFINPNVVLYGALAAAFGTPLNMGPDRKDMGYNPQTAAQYEVMYQNSVTQLIFADEARHLTMWTYEDQNINFGDNWRVSHDEDALFGNY